MTLVEALVVVGIVGVSVMAMGTITVGVARTRARVEQDVVGGYVLDGFLEEAVRARPGQTPTVPSTRLVRLKWVQLWTPEADRAGVRAGPLVERRVTPDGVGVSVRFNGPFPRELSASVHHAEVPR